MRNVWVLRHKPPAELSERARSFVEAFGTAEAAKILDVSAPTLARIIAGLPVRRGSVRCIERALARRDRAAERAEVE